MQGCPLRQGTSFIMSAAGSIDFYKGIGYNVQALKISSMPEKEENPEENILLFWCNKRNESFLAQVLKSGRIAFEKTRRRLSNSQRMPSGRPGR